MGARSEVLPDRPARSRRHAAVSAEARPAPARDRRDRSPGNPGAAPRASLLRPAARVAQRRRAAQPAAHRARRARLPGRGRLGRSAVLGRARREDVRVVGAREAAARSVLVASPRAAATRRAPGPASARALGSRSLESWTRRRAPLRRPGAPDFYVSLWPCNTAVTRPAIQSPRCMNVPPRARSSAPPRPLGTPGGSGRSRAAHRGDTRSRPAAARWRSCWSARPR